MQTADGKTHTGRQTHTHIQTDRHTYRKTGERHTHTYRQTNKQRIYTYRHGFCRPPPSVRGPPPATSRHLSLFVPGGQPGSHGGVGSVGWRGQFGRVSWGAGCRRHSQRAWARISQLPLASAIGARPRSAEHALTESVCD